MPSIQLIRPQAPFNNVLPHDVTTLFDGLWRQGREKSEVRWQERDRIPKLSGRIARAAGIAMILVLRLYSFHQYLIP